MNSERKFQSKLTYVVSALLVLFSFASCSVLKTKPVVPVFMQDVVPSWDGEEQNSGLIGYIDGKGYVLTPSAAARYSYLTEIYGKDYSPPLAKGVGLTKDEASDNYFLSTQYMVEFVVMNQKFKSAIPPKPSGSK
jgi:hypothetical protein